MRNIFCAITAGSLILFLGSISGAAETENGAIRSQDHIALIAQTGASSPDLSNWVKNIKPAAGYSTAKSQQRENYWEVKVNRKFRRRTAE